MAVSSFDSFELYAVSDFTGYCSQLIDLYLSSNSAIVSFRFLSDYLCPSFEMSPVTFTIGAILL